MGIYAESLSIGTRHLRLVSIETWVPASSSENPDWHFVPSER